MSTMNPSADEVRLVSLKTACEMTSLSRTMINRYRSEGRWPAAVSCGDKRIAFVKSEVTEWINARIAARGANDNSKPQAGREAA
jgi:prophage regulatory protein